VFGNIVASGNGFEHDKFLKIASKAHGGFDVLGQGSFITTGQQNHHLFSLLFMYPSGYILSNSNL
jgi:hypothetical protein